MYWLASLLALQLVIEGVVCSEGHRLPLPLRKIAVVAAVLPLGIITIALCAMDWQVWVWMAPMTVYRLINLLRMYRGRLPAPHLRTVSLRAFNWLVMAQVVVTTTALLVVRYGWDSQLFVALVVAQLLAAVILLRSTLHTWRHAGAPNDRTVALSDREVPSVSVLVPARNETDDLERCLQAITASDYPKLEVLVYDDCSVNRRTPEIIRSFAHQGVRFIQGDVPDESRWLAKNYAYARLAAEASGDLLLFCGVDARLEPHSIRQLVWLLQQRGKDMVSVMPLRAPRPGSGSSVLQAMRYYWEICLPRRFFKRPPVLSTCWLIRRDALQRMGGFEAASRAVVPEAPLARQAVTTDVYGFIRSDPAMGIYSSKSADEQYATSVRVRYPQLHRRLELVALAAFCELGLLVAPFAGLLLAHYLLHAVAYVAMWVVALLCLFTTYGLVTVGARLTNRWFGWLLMPVAFLVDLIILHISLWQYEFGEVNWKGRNVCVPVMQIEPRLPPMPSATPARRA
jgi:chlorobactene glucosyltransferase